MPPVPQEVLLQRDETASGDGDKIVISGMSGLYPQSRNVMDLSEILYNKINPIKPNCTRWEYSHPEVSQCIGLVPDLGTFDAQFFKVHYRLSNAMDSMARKVLEQAYQAIYDAGVSSDQLWGKKVGVFVGSCFSESEKASFYDASSRNGFGISGCNKSMFANRISYWLNAKGPSVAIDEACCSSLAALEQGYLAIKRGDCESAIVGGANLCLHPQSSVHYSRIMKLCKDGKTKSFDQNADGCAKSEAINVLFLQKAKDSLRIYGEVCHIKSEFTGIMNTETGPRFGFYREPRVMVNFLKTFYEESGVPANAVEYVEAFGSAVPDVDKVELEVIDQIFCKDREGPLLVGSVMSNIGYGEAASGISAVTKVLLGYEKGQLAGNLHCETPRQDVEGVREGRIQILNDHTRFGRAYTAVNGISVSGVNAHVLLHGYYKPKDINRYKCNIPRLVTISGRHESAVRKIIDDLKSRPVDPEELALLHNVYKTKITGHVARGFVILDTEADATVSLHEKVDYFNDVRRPLWFVYSGMGSQWVGMGAQLLRIPIFAAAIERCHQALAPKGINIVDIITSKDKAMFDNILHSFVGIAAIQIGLTDVLHALGIVPDKIIGHSVGELGCAYADGCLTAEEMILAAYSRGLVSVQTPFIRGSMAAVGLGYQQISKMCPPEIEVACHNGPESSTISGPADIMREFVGTLTAKGIFAKEVPCSNIPYHSRYIAEAGPALLKHLNEVIKNPRARSDKWVSTSVPQDKWNEPIAKLSSAEYHTNNLLSSVLFEETSALIPPSAVLVEVAPHGLLQAILKRSLHDSCCNIALTRRGHPDNAYLVLEAVGKLYMEGYIPKVEALYPKVEFPVSTGTPMLSHTVEWAHDEKWSVPLYVSAHRQLASSCKFVLNVYDEEYSYLRGNILKGRMVYPFAAALVAVWDTLAMFTGVPKKQLSVQFRDVQLLTQPVLHEQRQLRLSVALHRGTGRFEVMDDYSKVATGIIRPNRIKHLPDYVADDVMDLKSEDIYALMHNKEYSYSGDFRSIYAANSSITEALMLWRGNWVTLLDGLLQLNALRHQHKGISVPKQIGSLYIHLNEHRKHQMKVDGETVIKAVISDVHKQTRCGGITIDYLQLRDLPLTPEDNLVLKTLQFVPRFSNHLDFISTLYVFLQIVAENVNKKHINITSLVSKKKAPKISKEIKSVLTQMNTTDFRYEEINVEDMNENEDDLLADSDVVFFDGLTIDDEFYQLLHRTLKPDSFVVTEDDTLEESVRPSAIYRTVSVSGGLQLVRWRPSRTSSNHSAVSVFTAADIPALTAARAAMHPQARLHVLAPHPPPQGLTDLIRSWRTEPTRNNVSLVVTDSETPEPMDADIQLAVNVWNEGQWGGEYDVPVQEKHESARSTLQSANIGDIESVQWVQAVEPVADGVKVNVHYAALNTLDVLKATGRGPFGIKNDLSSTGFGMDFSGVTDSGARVMGVVARGACSSEVRAAPELLWPVPAHWSLEDAATVPLPYLSAFYCFLRTMTRSGLVEETEERTLLVHGGAGALGQAAISIGLGLGYQVFTTVSDVTKKQFLLRLYPQLKEEHIGNSRDNSFGDMVLNATNGKGCYIVINTVRGDLKNVSLQCCSDAGTTYDLSQLSHQEYYTFPTFYLSRARSYVALDLSSLIKNLFSNDNKKLHGMLSEGIARGYVRPLSRVSYAPHAASRALRLLAASAHRGRVLLHLRDSHLHVLPRIQSKPDDVHLIVTDRSSLGLHLADRLISRGARKLHVHCAVPTPHLRYKLRSWQQGGVQVETSSEDFNEEGISSLMHNVARRGAVTGIYVIAADTSTQTDDKCLSALNTLDLHSRKLCPSLRYFAIISSDMIGQHTCMDRVNNGYPATMLKFNVIETSGSVPSAAQWRGVVSAAERALHSPQPALRAHQLPAPARTFLQQVADVANVTIQEDAPNAATLESFGVHEEQWDEIRLFLELSHNVALNEEEVRALTIQRIREIGAAVIPTGFKAVKGLGTFYSHVDPDELLATTEIVFLPTHTTTGSMRQDEFDGTQTYLCIVPGLEGLHNRFSYLCERLKLPALVLQPGLDRPYETIQETAQKYAQVLLKRVELKDNFYLLGYEWGVPVALEVASILEGQGMTGTVFCVGVAPEELKDVLEEELSEYKSEEELENGVLEHMFKLMTGDKRVALDEMLRGCHSWDKKVEACVRTLLGRVLHSAQYTRALLQAALGRIAQARRYTSALPPLRSRVLVLRASRAAPARSRRLGALTAGDVAVHALGAPLAHAARDARCAAIINSHLDQGLLDRFHNKNLCDTYLLNEGTFMDVTTDIGNIDTVQR